MKTKIKICGVRSVEIAEYCVAQGADFIGLVFCRNSKRFVENDLAKSIAKAVKNKGAIPIGVFTDADEKSIKNICDNVGIEHVQLHGEQARNAFLQLPESLHKIYVLPFNGDEILPYDPEHIEQLRSKQDYVMFDGIKAGSGRTIAWHAIKQPAHLEFFLAGGLTPDNVATAIATCHPYAVDVSSGVEISGEKSEVLIKQFIQAVNGELA